MFTTSPNKLMLKSSMKSNNSLILGNFLNFTIMGRIFFFMSKLHRSWWYIIKKVKVKKGKKKSKDGDARLSLPLLSNFLPRAERNPDKAMPKDRVSFGEVDKSDPVYTGSTGNFCPTLRARNAPRKKMALWGGW